MGLFLSDTNKANQPLLNIDSVNIGLMVVSLAAAYFFPFYLFLFSYAILGPLHYMTEIFWLKQSGYYLPKRKDYTSLVAVTLLLVLLYFLSRNQTFVAVFPSISKNYRPLFYAILFSGFVWVLCLLFIKDKLKQALLTGSSFIVAIAFSKLAVFTIVFGSFMLTVIHVFIFTGAFILYGSMKSKQKIGKLSFLLYCLFPLSIFLIPLDSGKYQLNEYITGSITAGGFDRIIFQLKQLIYADGNGNLASLSESILRIQIFLAYSYTYHYLNWFSKVEIIKWHKVPMFTIRITLVLWVISIGVYIYNYRLGLSALFFLSLLHVVMEWPLNIKTFQHIGEELKRSRLFNSSSS